MQNTHLRHLKQSLEEQKSNSKGLPNVQLKTQLFSFDEIRLFQQDNVYITHGYRANLTGLQCLKSAFSISNELVNIWTHGGMVLPLILTTAYDQIFLLPTMQATWIDHLIFLQFMTCCLICSIFSAAFHIFNCHKNVNFATCCYSLDLYGIILTIIGIYALALYYGFYCIPNVRFMYTCVVVVLMLVTAKVMLHPQYLSERSNYLCANFLIGLIHYMPEATSVVPRAWKSWNWRSRRVGLFTFLAVFGVFPISHWFLVAPINEVQMFLPDVLILYSILGSAMFFYWTRFPEKLWPGQFNLFGHSHNWWHLLISAGFFYMRRTALRILKFRIITKCIMTL